MVWFNDISELQYYNPILGFPCYCELLVEPSDLTMQHVISAPTSGVTALIEVYSADGVTNYGDYTNYFTVTYGTNQNSQTYFQIQLNTFAPPMCEHLCWILKVTLSIGSVTIFEKWTERFCNVSCCATARVIQVENDDTTVTVHNIEPLPAWADCDTPIVRIETWNDCFDKFTGEYYGNGFRKVTNIRGRYLRKPRNIEKIISLNCKVQRVQSARLYQLEAWDYFPEWKMDEIELQLQAQHIKINGSEMVFTGGTPFAKPDICQQIYLLNAEFQECNAWQVFGCAPCTTTYTAYYRLGEGTDVYDENRRNIGSDPEGVANYFRTLNGVLTAEVISPTVDCAYVAVIAVTGTGYIPPFIYEGGVLPKNKVYSVSSVDDICTNVPEECTAPTIGTVNLVEVECETPVIGTITQERQVLIPANFTATLTATDGTSFSDGDYTSDVEGAQMMGYNVIAIATDAQEYNTAFFTKPLNSDTLTSTNDAEGNPRLNFYVGQVITIFIQ